MQHRIEIVTLGRFELRLGPSVLDERHFGTRRCATLLKHLANEPGLRASADVLVDRLWPDSSPVAGRTNLRVKLHEARALLRELVPATGDDEPLLFDGTILAFNPRYAYDLDAQTFESRAHALLIDPAKPLALAERCAEALHDYGGTYLPGIDHEAIDINRKRFARVHRALLRRCADAWAAAQRPGAYAEVLERAFATYPDDEAFATAWIAHLTNAARGADAREALARHGGALDVTGGPGPAAFLGELVRASDRRDRVDASALVGRDCERRSIDVALASIARGHSSCFVISGMPGVGKSRLLAEAAERARARGFAVVTDSYGGESFASAEHPLARPDDLLRKIGARGVTPAAILLDDVPLHADHDEAHLDALLRRLAGTPTLVALVRRSSDTLARAIAKTPPSARDITIDPLDERDTRNVVRGWFDAPVSDRVLDAVVEMWPGNLGIAAAIVQHLKLTQIVVARNGRLTFEGEPARETLVPEIARRAILRRLSLLPKIASDAALALAFASRPVDVSVVCVMLGLARDEVAEALDVLERCNLARTERGTFSLAPAIAIVAAANTSRARARMFVDRLARAIETLPQRRLS